MDYRKEYADATMPKWAEELDLLPAHMVDGMVRYILQGIPPGDFLTAVLAGDLFTALRKADDWNIASLPNYGRFLYNYAPSECFGTADRVDVWINRGGLAGKKDDAA